jgi:mono/diheme cytochrome c family protein
MTFMNKVLALSAVAAAFVTTVSCGSGGQDDGNPAKADFVNNVYPNIAPTCAGCHASGKHGAPIFLSDNPEGSYTAITAITGFIASPAQSPLIQKGVHSGPALTDVQTTLVSDWLVKEVGTAGDTSKPTNLRAAFKAFGACMDYQEWLAAGLDQMAQTATSGGQCISCHNQGTASVWLSDDPAVTFTKFTSFPYVQRLVTGTVTEQGQFDKIVDARRLIDKGNDRRQLNANHHPTFNLGDGTNTTPSAMQQALSNFVSDTINKMYRINGCTNVAKPDAGAPDAGP